MTVRRSLARGATTRAGLWAGFHRFGGGLTDWKPGRCAVELLPILRVLLEIRKTVIHFTAGVEKPYGAVNRRPQKKM